MAWHEETDTAIYKVVINHEEQYSIWPAERENPLGWFDVGKSGLKQDCLDYIAEVWTDMRPLSLRQHMATQVNQPPPAPPQAAPTDGAPAMDELVQRLSTGHHPVVLSRDNSTVELQQSIERGYVHIKFTATRGGTELGVRLDNTASTLGQGPVEAAGGTIRLVGYLTLNGVNVRCVANIDLSTLHGTGYLEPLEA